MSHLILLLLAFTGGIFLALQGGLNAQLGVLLRHPLLATVVAFFFSTFFALLLAAGQIRQLPSRAVLQQVPVYMWFAGGFCSVVGISLYYYTIPKLGVATMISLGLCGQLIFAVVAGHFGWLHLPMEPLTIKKTIGVVAIIGGILLINIK
ncbi:DMT family transporter [Chitinophaga pendula]|uniref:DMT family transporter n=1 Tax=Chitinophaga TaxID=79328 RepID=UPI000BB093C6|nr:MULTISPECIES: DMT family transporter [Chitinophaga]ASZ14088.1 hypothetical protein CK934_25630 [Chitinophaga sp. MD30]UCJ08279.1 DMT family transporter [Chitinophaga pendula]